MKNMDRCSSVAFCAMVLIYCSLITGDDRCVCASPSSSSSSPVSAERRDAAPETHTHTHSTNRTRSTEPTPGTLANSPPPVENGSSSVLNIGGGRIGSDVNNQTAVPTVRPATPPALLPSATHEPTSNTHPQPSPAVPSPPAAAGTQRSAVGTQRSAVGTQRSAVGTQRSAVGTQRSASSSPVQTRAHADTPSALNVGDRGGASSDPLLAGLLSALVVVAAIVSVLVFLKLRNTNDGPEFRRLQDLPMDDMQEDAPLSMYSY